MTQYDDRGGGDTLTYGETAAGDEVPLLVDDSGNLQAAIQFIDENGVAYGIRHIDNKPNVSTKPYLFEIAEGNIADHHPVRRFGHNENVGTAIETVAHASGLAYYPTSAERLQISSDDADDDGDPPGTGVRTVWVRGLDADWAIQSETVTLNGTTAVTTGGYYIRMLKMKVATAGSSGGNEGQVCAKDNAGANTLMCIAAVEGESHSAAYSVPAGQTVYLTQWHGSEGSSKGSEITLWVREFGGLWLQKRGVVLFDSNFTVSFDLPFKLTEKTDIELRAKGILAGAHVTASFEGWRE